MLTSSRLLCLLIALGWSSSLFGQVQVDEALPTYAFEAREVAGTIKSVGSDTMDKLMQRWTEEFQAGYKSVRPEVEGQGSSKAMPALIAGAALFGPMSRDPKESEIAEFEKKFGYKPTMVPTSIDMLGVFVHRDNPLTFLTLAQVDAVFSTTRKLGGKTSIETWGQLGVKGEFAKSPITLFSRNASSGTYGFFKEKVLGNGDFKASVSEQSGSASVIQSVAGNRFAMGYSGIGYKTEGVKALALSLEAGSQPVEPTPENAYSGEYPLARFLFLALNYKPNSKLDPLRAEFIRFIFSKQGQTIVAEQGFFPVDADTARHALKSVGLEPGF